MWQEAYHLITAIERPRGSSKEDGTIHSAIGGQLCRIRSAWPSIALTWHTANLQPLVRCTTWRGRPPKGLVAFVHSLAASGTTSWTDRREYQSQIMRISPLRAATSR